MPPQPPPLPPPSDTKRLRMDSDDLRRLARLISGRLTLHCPRCGDWRRLTVEAREIRYGSSPDLSAVDPRHPGRPRLQFFCMMCHRVIGYVQADEWAPDPAPGAGDADGTRWDRLELEDHDPRDR
jgi:hypothetical protein